MKTNLAMALVGAALISLPAAAQMSPPADSPPKTTQSSAASASPMYEMKAGQWRATKLSGVAVYNNNNERIGDVNELIVSRDGKIEAVVIGVGGFLGMGEHLAAVPFAQVKWMDQPRPTATSSTTTGSGTTGSGTSTATSESPAAGGTTERTTTTTTTTDRAAGTTTTGGTRDAYRGYPDHAVVDMTKEQLKALPVVQYAR
jgi:sporulation protein YlmC with PRC-barrel domain